MWSFKENENLHIDILWLLQFTCYDLGHHGSIPITTNVQILSDCHVPLKIYKTVTMVDLQIYSIDAWELPRTHMMVVNKVCVVWVSESDWLRETTTTHKLSFPHRVSYIKLNIWAFSTWSLFLLSGNLCLNGIWQGLYLQNGHHNTTNIWVIGHWPSLTRHCPKSLENMQIYDNARFTFFFLTNARQLPRTHILAVK